MKIKNISISNYRSIKKIELNMADILQLVGKNNAGKSNILNAIDIFFNISPSLTLQDFIYKNKYAVIEIVVIFNKFNNTEKRLFAEYIVENEINIKLICEFNNAINKIQYSRYILIKIPKDKYLQKSQVNKKNINNWLKENTCDKKFTLILNKDSSELNWNSTIDKYLEKHSEYVKYTRPYIKFDTHLKILFKDHIPKCIFISAVRTIEDETKTAQTNPFGIIVNHMLSLLSKKDKKNVSGHMEKIRNIFNGSRRLSILVHLEELLNKEFSNLTNSESNLHINIPMPTYEEIIKNIEINVTEKDGTLDQITHKGHGFQRYAIFSLLKTYAEITKNNARSAIFLIEEPELYLHPQAQHKFLNILNDISSKNDQVIYATHSNILINLCDVEKICVVRKIERYTDITQITNKAIDDKLKIAYGGTSHTINSQSELHQFSRPMATFGFFADKIILVEGYTEEISFSIYVKQNSDIDSNTVIINTSGVVHMPIYQIVYNAFNIPCFVIFDDDNNKPTQSHLAQDALYKLLKHDRDKYPIIKNDMCVFENNYSDQIKKECEKYNEIMNTIPESDRTRKPYVAKIISEKIVNNEIPMLDSIKKIMEKISKLAPEY